MTKTSTLERAKPQQKSSNGTQNELGELSSPKESKRRSHHQLPEVGLPAFTTAQEREFGGRFVAARDRGEGNYAELRDELILRNVGLNFWSRRSLTLGAKATNNPRGVNKLK